MENLLISERQLQDISTSKIKGLVQSAIQRIRPTQDNQQQFLMTILPDDAQIIQASLEVNGVPYEEISPQKPDAEFTRQGFLFNWMFTEANGGFNIDRTMIIVLRVYYVDSDDMTITTPSIVRPIIVEDDVEPSQIIGNFDEDPIAYEEHYDMTQENIEEFLGVSVNGALYSHPYAAFYNDSTKTMTIRQLRIEENDSLAIMSA